MECVCLSVLRVVPCGHYPWCIGPHCKGHLPWPWFQPQQQSLLQAWDLRDPLALPLPSSDIWWPSMETNSNLLTSGRTLPPWVLTSSGETQMVSTSGWYTSYWNAFLLVYKIAACQRNCGKVMFSVMSVCPQGDLHVTTAWIFSLGEPQPWPQIPLLWGISPYSDFLISWTCSNLITWTWTDSLLTDWKVGGCLLIERPSCHYLPCN